MVEHIRVGILADPDLWTWQVSALEKIAELKNVEITFVIIDGTADKEVAKLDGVVEHLSYFSGKLRTNGLYPFVHADQKIAWMLSRDNAREEYLDSIETPDAEVLSDAQFMRCSPLSREEGSKWNVLPRSVINAAVQSADIFVRFGFGLLTGDILTEPKYGVLSTHGSDIRKYRGLGPQAMFINREEKAVVTLQQLTNDIDGGKIVCVEEAELSYPYTLSDIWAKTREIQTQIYANGIHSLRKPSFKLLEPDDLGEYYSKAYKNSARFVAKMIVANNKRRLLRWCE